MEDNRSEFSQLQNNEQLRKERKKITRIKWLQKILEADERPFKCKECPKKYANQGTLYRHKTLHSNVKKFKCDICGKTFRTDNSLRSHVVVHNNSHLEKTLKCDQCPHMFKIESQLKSHGKVHVGDRKYKCETCLQKFTHSGSLKNHMRSHKSETPICDVCKKGVVHLKNHIARVHKKETHFSCEHCSKKFYDKKDHDTHVKNKHGSREKTFKCDQCPKKYPENHVLKDHLRRIHSTSYDYPCEQCDKKFKVSRVLQRHIHEVHRPTIDVFYCTVCSKGLSSKLKLKSHNKSHLEKVKCEKCPVVVQATKLRSHIKNKHSEKETHICKICEKQLTSICSLRKHALLHTSRARNFGCHTCNSEFITAKNLSDHQIIHTSEKPFKCAAAGCFKSFNNKGTFHRHRASQHI